MSQGKGSEPIAEDRRKEIFRALVEAQDQDVSVPQSRRLIAERYGVSEGQVRQIEQEGLDQEWPPL
jgi:DNA-directed RNA polymerase sigma subunit (sigma70/sigma32)